MGYCAFYSCTSLTTPHLPDRLTHIGDYAFEGHRNLSRIITTRKHLEVARNAIRNFPNIKIFAIEDLYPSLANSTSKSKNAALSLLDLTAFAQTFDPTLKPSPLLKIPQPFLSKTKDAGKKYCHTLLFSKFSDFPLTKLQTLFEPNSFKVLRRQLKNNFLARQA